MTLLHVLATGWERKEKLTGWIITWHKKYITLIGRELCFISEENMEKAVLFVTGNWKLTH